jgi:predicted polyphosphate/ATP-dependent NAD kinase
MSIKTNSLDYVIDKQKIEEKYDIFCLETSEKYIKRGAYILDVSVMCNDIKAIKFESGRKMLLLMSKNLDNKRKLKELLGEVTRQIFCFTGCNIRVKRSFINSTFIECIGIL